MKVLVTGASGFVGRNLIPYLNKSGFDAIPISLRNESWSTCFSSDADVLIHLAGKAHDTQNTSNSDEYFSINRDLTIEGFNEFLKSDIRDFFYFSSVKAVADQVEDVLKEDVDGSPKTPYGKSKLEAEKYLLSQKLPLGKRLFIIRPCMIHGPGNKGNLNLLYKLVEKGIPWPLASFENQRSFIAIDNLCFLIAQMIRQNEVESGVYNFADDELISTNQLIEIIAEATGKKTKLWHLSKNIMVKLALLGDKLHLPLNSERLKKLTESYAVSNEKIKAALYIQKLPLSAKNGLIITIHSFQTK